MSFTKQLFIIILLVVIIYGCKRNPLKVNISDVDTNVEIVNFGDALFTIEQSNSDSEITKLHDTYPDFFDLFSYRIIRIGGIKDEGFPELLMQFTTDTMIQNIKTLVDAEFSDFKKIEKQITKSFKYFQYHFPEKEIPTIYTYISGFNQSVVTAENIVGISLDKYLGRDCHYYKKLNTTPQYKTLNMHKDKIASDVAMAWGITEFEETNKATNLMGNIIHHGKLMYFVDAMLPTEHDSIKIGYTKKQLEFCMDNETEMWTYLVDKELLFSSKRMDIIRYINDGPRTTGFPNESPARTGVWIGWQIVRQYMKKYPEITLSELMQNSNYQQILNDSEYFPD